MSEPDEEAGKERGDLLALRTRQLRHSDDLWLAAAKLALAGDPRTLRDRVRLIEESRRHAADDVKVVQSARPNREGKDAEHV